MGAPRVLSQVEKALRAAGVADGERVVAAVSGGVDSMVLLDVLDRLRTRLGLRLHVLHVHHGLRGKSADRDAAFVVAEAVRRGHPVSVVRLDPRERPAGTSIQVWAREARYRSLEAVRDRVKAAWTLTAHTLNDQAETVLLNLLRGTGTRGLAGIPPARDRILRPLLSVSRAQVEAHAMEHHVPFRSDASNDSDVYRRNRIRHQLLPLLAKEYNPRIVESLAALAAFVREDEAALTAMAADLLAAGVRVVEGGVQLDVPQIRSATAAVARRAFHEAFRLAARGAHGLTRRHLRALAALLAQEGSVRLPDGLEATRSGKEINIGLRGATPGTLPVDRVGPVEGTGEVPVRVGRWTRWPPLGWRLRVRGVAATEVHPGLRDRWREILSPVVLAGPLVLRSWRPGDRFRPLGLRGQKKLQDFFVDAKVPRRERIRIPLLLTGGRIAWVVGHRIADEFRWQGAGPACLAEVEFQEEAHAVPGRPDPHQRC